MGWWRRFWRRKRLRRLLGARMGLIFPPKHGQSRETLRVEITMNKELLDQTDDEALVEFLVGRIEKVARFTLRKRMGLPT